MKVSNNFEYPKPGSKIRIKGTKFDPDRFGFYVGKNRNGDLILDMDKTNILPDDFKIELIHPWDNFEVIE